MRLAVLVMAEASVPSRRRRGFDAGSQGTVTWRFVRVIVFGRIGCHALVAAMAYIAGHQRRIAAMGCRLHSAQVLPQRIVRRDSFSTGSAARVRLETGSGGLMRAQHSKIAPALGSPAGPCGCSRVATAKGRNLQLRPVVEQAGEL